MWRYRFWKKFRWDWILVGCVIMAILVGGAFLLIYLIERPVGLWRWLFFETNLDARKYLLSATAQVLGAIFALMFSLSIVAGQTLVRYTHRALTVIYNRRLFIYALAFAGIVIGTLCCLCNPTDGLAIIMVGLGGIFTVLSTPAFFWYIVQGLNLQRIPMLIKRTGLYAIKRGESQKAKEMIEALDNIGTVALKEGNFEAVEAAEEALGDLLFEVGRFHNDPQGKHPEHHQEIYKTLRAACLEAIDNPRVPRIIIKKLGEVGSQAIKDYCGKNPDQTKAPKDALDRQPPKTEYYAENIIMDVAKACEKSVHARLLYKCAETYKKMLEAAREKNNITIQEDYIDKLHFVYGRFLEKDKKWEDWRGTCKKDVEEIIRTYPDINTTLKNKLNKLKNALEKKHA